MDNIRFGDYFTENKSFLRDNYRYRKNISQDNFSSSDNFNQSQFQNEIWLFFYDLLIDSDYLKMNVDPNDEPNVFNDSNNSEKSVDTLIETKEMFLFIESTTSQNINSYVDRIISDFGKYKREVFKNKTKNIALVLHSKYIPNDAHLDKLFDNDINLISEDDLINFKKLRSESNNTHTYYQFLNFLFGPMKNSTGQIKKAKYVRSMIGPDFEANKNLVIPAIKSNSVDYGNSYLFSVKPKEILMMSSVPHRKPSVNRRSTKNITFQRMIDSTKIKNIRKYLNNNGSFPTNIIVNIDDLPSRPFQNQKLTIPRRFSNFTIIDGQHRLFAYLGLTFDDDISEKTRISITAYSGLTSEQQMNIFIGINENQKPVDPNLMWDLYTEIYSEQDPTPNTVRKYLISEFLKRINTDEEHPLFKKFNYPSSPFSDSADLKLSSIGSIINSSAFFKSDEFFRTFIVEHSNRRLSESDKKIKEEKIIADFFNAVKDVAGESWDNVNWYKDNRAFSVYLRLIKPIMQHVKNNSNEDENILLILAEQFEKYLKPVHDKIISFDNQYYQNTFQEKGGKNIEKIYDKVIRFINEAYPTFLKEQIDADDFSIKIDGIYEELKNNGGETEELEAKTSYLMVPSVYDLVFESTRGNEDLSYNRAKAQSIEWKSFTEDGNFGEDKIGTASIRDDLNKVVNAFSNGIGGKIIIGLKEHTSRTRNRFEWVGIHKYLVNKYSDTQLEDVIKEDIEKYNPDIIIDVSVGNKLVKSSGKLVKVAVVSVEPISLERLNSRLFYKIQKRDTRIPGLYADKYMRRDGERSTQLDFNRADSHITSVKRKLNDRDNLRLDFENYGISEHSGRILISKLPKTCPRCHITETTFQRALITFSVRNGNNDWQSRCNSCR